MKLRAPDIPLITVDPYFSVWSNTDKLTDDCTKHWSGKPNTLIGKINVDGEDFTFMGKTDGEIMTQTAVDIKAMNTKYTFENEKIRLYADFFTPLFMDKLEILSRPVSYLFLDYKSIDGEEHKVRATISASEELCLNLKGQSPVVTEEFELEDGIKGLSIANSVQNVLGCAGDDVRIDWGTFYLSSNAENVSAKVFNADEMTFVSVEADVCECCGALFTFAYDDVYSIEYYGEKLKSVWNNEGKTIKEAISDAYGDYEELYALAQALSDKLFIDSVKAGGEKYAEILQLAYRQAIAAHKVALDKNGEIVFISKECFSCGAAATADVSYPSIPLFLYGNPELVKGMIRPIIRFNESGIWPFDFAPHDCGTYPIVNGQLAFGEKHEFYQMPVEECGNMLIMLANVCICDNNATFAMKDIKTYEKWAEYLIRYGKDPENQLCTDDFAGHLAHNCNLSIKSIMGLAGLSIVFGFAGDDEKCKYYREQAENMAGIWCETAFDSNGGYRLAFDRPGTFSMKYNMIWDKVWSTNLFPRQVIDAELFSNESHFNPYGLPLDNRATYTKADWLVWTASLSSDREIFERFVEPLWKAYNFTKSRVPMTDWYDTITSAQIGFQNRTVVGGLFIRLLDVSEKVKIYK